MRLVLDIEYVRNEESPYWEYDGRLAAEDPAVRQCELGYNMEAVVAAIMADPALTTGMDFRAESYDYGIFPMTSNPLTGVAQQPRQPRQQLLDLYPGRERREIDLETTHDVEH